MLGESLQMQLALTEAHLAEVDAEDLRADCDETAARCQVLEQELHAVQRQLASAQAEAQAGRSELASEAAQVAELRASLATQAQAQDTLVAEHAALVAAHSASTAELAAAAVKETALEQARAQEIDRLMGQLSTAQAAVTSTREEAARAHASAADTIGMQRGEMSAMTEKLGLESVAREDATARADQLQVELAASVRTCIELRAAHDASQQVRSEGK